LSDRLFEAFLVISPGHLRCPRAFTALFGTMLLFFAAHGCGQTPAAQLATSGAVSSGLVARNPTIDLDQVPYNVWPANSHNRLADG
jgi:hypothetical protein